MAQRPKRSFARRSLKADQIIAEVDFAPFVLEAWHGRDWEFTHLEMLDSADVDAIPEDNKIEGLMRLAMGDEAWEEFDSHPKTVGFLKRIYEAYGQYCGMTPGK